MRLMVSLGLLVCLGPGFARAAEEPEVTRAKAGIEKLRALVEAGALPRAQLERAKASLADAQDAAILRRTLYGPDLTEQQTEEMIAAAARRVDRRQNEFDKAERLVREGVTSMASLDTFQEELDGVLKEYRLALSRARLTEELAMMARAEQTLHQHLETAPQEAHQIAERFDGAGVFASRDLDRVESAFEREFSKPLPVSAIGETAVHRALGFDHRGRVDVALSPDQPEGVWLRHYLAENGIPYFAFRQAVPGKATGAHIHIGPASTHL